jgi:hypothetical protein
MSERDVVVVSDVVVVVVRLGQKRHRARTYLTQW